MIRKFFKSLLSQKGQSLVLYALLVPLFIILIGAVIDLGWYFLNVSRLQNAADAAALAGAEKILEDNEYFANYKKVVLISANGLEFDSIDEDLMTEPVEKIIQSGDETALKYANNNLSDLKEVPANKKITDTWTKRDVTFSANLWTQKKTETVAEAAEEEDEQKSFSGTLYYQVILNGKANHLFKILDDVTENDIKVSAVTQLVYQTPPPPEIDDPKRKKLMAENVVSGNWELEAAKGRGAWSDPTKREKLVKEYGKDFFENNYFIRNAIENNYPKEKIWLNYNPTNSTNAYDKGTFYRYSKVDGNVGVEVSPGKGRYKTGGTSSEKYPDSLTLGFRQDIVRVNQGYLEIQDGKIVSIKDGGDAIFLKDWDIRQDTPYNRKTEVRYINPSKYWDESCDLRIHNIFNFNTPFDVRANKVTEENPYDILWVRIESEAFLPLWMLGVTDRDENKHVQYKSVRQIILNINSDNTVKDGDKYKYRPVVMFYDGPEKIDMNSRARTPRPIILNLNADFRGAIFAPTTAVIINPNGHKFYGFIVAKEYRKLATGGGHSVKYNNKIFVDDYGEVLSDPVSMYKCGYYDTFNIGGFGDYDYELEDDSANNLFTS